MKKVNLHIHTNYSDGTFSPREVIEMANNFGLNVISITDHDNLDGYREAIQYAQQYNIELIPGVEISASHQNREVHILAYNIDPNSEEFNQLLNSIYNSRFLRAKKIVQKLAELDIYLDFDEIQKKAGENNYLGRPHISNALIENGFCKDKFEAFEKYLGEHCYAYIPKLAPDVKEVIEQVRKAGGISVLAHPYSLRNDNYVYDIISFGIDGLEVFYAKCNDALIYHYNEIALKNGLIRTGGSDFHGEGYDLKIFEKFSVPDYILDELKRGV